VENDPEFGVDRLVSAILDFGDIQSSFACSTQLVPHQRMLFFGTEKKLEVTIPFNAPPDRACRLRVSAGDLFEEDIEIIDSPVCNQYTIQGDLFSSSILNDQDPPMSLEDSIKNMAVIDAIFRSAKSGRWEQPSGSV
jgi:predicted dehydrogenase